MFSLYHLLVHGIILGSLCVLRTALLFHVVSSTVFVVWCDLSFVFKGVYLVLVMLIYHLLILLWLYMVIHIMIYEKPPSHLEALHPQAAAKLQSSTATIHPMQIGWCINRCCFGVPSLESMVVVFSSLKNTTLKTNISPPKKGIFEDDVPFPVWWDMLVP